MGPLTYSSRMSPENAHKLMGFYMEVLIPGVIVQYMVSAALAVSNRVYRVKFTDQKNGGLRLHGEVVCMYLIHIRANHRIIKGGWALTRRWALARENTVHVNKTQLMYM